MTSRNDEALWGKLVEDLSQLPVMNVGDIVTMQHFQRPRRLITPELVGRLDEYGWISRVNTPCWRHIFRGGGE